MKSEFKMIFLLILVILLVDTIFLWSIFKDKKSEDKQVCFNEKCFSVEIADEPRERINGLMGRESLDEDAGMLFIFDKEEVQGFWMKDTSIPLDMIWINSSNDVIYIKENAQPCEQECEIYYSNESALYVLEVNAGSALTNDIKERDKVEIR